MSWTVQGSILTVREITRAYALFYDLSPHREERIETASLGQRRMGFAEPLTGVKHPAKPKPHLGSYRIDLQGSPSITLAPIQIFDLEQRVSGAQLQTDIRRTQNGQSGRHRRTGLKVL